MPVPASIRWQDGRLWLLDQRRLPGEVGYVEQANAGEVAGAIASMLVRGAPAIGVAAAYGMALAARGGEDLDAAAATLTTARPTAVNLAWAVTRVRRAADPVAEAEAIHREDTAMCRAIGTHGVGLLRDGTGVLTHCNAGALAVSALGTATAPMYLAHEAGVRFEVFVDETRPVLQGARLTAWELSEAGLDVTLICDGMAAHVMSQGVVDLVITGGGSRDGQRRCRQQDRHAGPGDRGPVPRHPVLRCLSVVHLRSGDAHRIGSRDRRARPGGSDGLYCDGAGHKRAQPRV